jgi:hypothetical protein
MFRKIYLILIISICSQIVFAEESQQNAENKELISSGFSKNQVWAIYGKPLSETSDARNNEAWRYQNNAVIFFREGRVTAWSNLETLRPKTKSARQADPVAEKNTDMILDSLFKK